MAAINPIEPPIAIRTSYLGIYTSDPAPTDESCWYYNSDDKCFKYWNGSAWIPWPAGDGLTWIEGSEQITAAKEGSYVMNVTVAGLTTISWVIDINIETNPVCDPGSVTNKVISGNVVGFTLAGVGMGTTLTAKVLAAGIV